MRKINKSVMLVVLTSLMLMACGDDIDTRVLRTTEQICSEDVKVLVVDSTMQCIKSAGVGGESEPEDWIWRCEQLAKDLYCPVLDVNLHQTLYDNRWHTDKIVEVDVEFVRLDKGS